MARRRGGIFRGIGIDEKWSTIFWIVIALIVVLILYVKLIPMIIDINQTLANQTFGK